MGELNVQGRSVQLVVETHIAYDRPTQRVTPEWVDFRLRFFHEYTLCSLLNQTLRGFDVFVQCGERHRTQLESFRWHPTVTVCWHNGRDEYARFDADYLAVTRIDSDDLFHRANMAEVLANVILGGKERDVLCWKTRLVWDRLNRYIVTDHPRASSPFFTHVFPRRVYQDWPRFERLHFRAHGSGGAGDTTARPLSRNRVCVVKHGWNHSKLKRGQRWPEFATAAERQAHFRDIRQKYPAVDIIESRSAMERMLEAFGIAPEKIP